MSTLKESIDILKKTDNADNEADRLNVLKNVVSQIQSNNTVNVIDNNPSVIQTLQAYPSINDINKGEINNLNGAKVRIKPNSINSLIAVCKEIHKNFDSISAPTIKDWIHVIKNIHPLVQNAIKDLMYFKPISDEVGSRVLAYTPDLASLELKDWDSGKAQSIRGNLKQKIDNDDLDNITASYNKLNKRQVINTSNEFFLERTRYNSMNLQGRIVNPIIYLNAHDFHLAGDTSYGTYTDPILGVPINHIASTSLLVLGILYGYLLGSIRLINYIWPISNYGTASNVVVEVEIEKQKTNIDMKGNIAQVPVSVINNSVLIPKTKDI